jgi:hypothetical protein
MRRDPAKYCVRALLRAKPVQALAPDWWPRASALEE